MRLAVTRVRRLALLLGFALVVHLLVIPQIGGARQALTVVGSVNPAWVALAVVLEGLSFLAYAWLTRLLIPPAHRPGLATAFGAVMASTAANHVVPGGAATTAAVNARMFGRVGVPGTELGFALGTQAIGSAVVLNLMLWLALLVSIPTSGFHPLYATAAGVGAVLITAFSAAVVAMVRGREGFALAVTRTVGRLPGVRAERVRGAMLSLADQLAALIGDRSRLVIVVALAATNWLLDAAALWVMLGAFGHRPGVVGLLVAYGLANVLAAIPVSPGGLGVIEAVLIPTLVGFGTPPAEASVGVVAYRLINFWLPIPVGALCYLILQRVVGHEVVESFRSSERRPRPVIHRFASPQNVDDRPPAETVDRQSARRGDRLS